MRLYIIGVSNLLLQKVNDKNRPSSKSINRLISKTSSGSFSGHGCLDRSLRMKLFERIWL